MTDLHSFIQANEQLETLKTAVVEAAFENKISNTNMPGHYSFRMICVFLDRLNRKALLADK